MFIMQLMIPCSPPQVNTLCMLCLWLAPVASRRPAALQASSSRVWGGPSGLFQPQLCAVPAVPALCPLYPPPAAHLTLVSHGHGCELLGLDPHQSHTPFLHTHTHTRARRAASDVVPDCCGDGSREPTSPYATSVPTQPSLTQPPPTTKTSARWHEPCPTSGLTHCSP